MGHVARITVRNSYKMYAVKKPKEKGLLEDLGIEGRIMLKLIVII
jgi:hypothetical protein